jgi:GAF domain-containing protein/CheY-like chemotaxis protein
VGDRHDQPHEAASGRGASLSRRRWLAVVLVLVGLAALWAAAGTMLTRRLRDREEIALTALAAAARARVAEAEALVRREAVLLAQDPTVIDGVARRDWPTLARDAVRIRALTLDGIADLVLVADAAGAPLTQVPSAPQLSAADTAAPAEPVVALRVLDAQAYVLARAPVRSGGVPIGLVAVARRLERVATAPGESAIALVSGDRLLGSTLPGLPAGGWAATAAGGRLVIDGRGWVLQPGGRVGEDVAWALVPEGVVGRERGWLWAMLGASFAIAAAGATLTLVLSGRPRALALAAPPPAPSLPPAPAALGSLPTVPEIERRHRELQAFYAAAVTLGSGSDLGATAGRTLEVVLGVAGMRVGMVYRLEGARERLTLMASRGLTDELTAHLRERAVDASPVGEVVRTGRFLVTDLTTSPLVDDPVLGRVIGEGQFHTELALPILTEGRVWGVLTLVSATPRAFDADLLTLLQGVALQVGLAVARSALLAETQEKSRRLETLARLAQGLSATLSGDQVLERVVGAAVELLDCSIARLWLLDDEGQRLTMGASAGPLASPEGLRTMAVGEGLVGLVVARREAVTMPDVLGDPRVRNTTRLRGEGVASAAAVPLRIGSRMIGALAIASRERREYSAEELALVQLLADQAAIAIDNARRFFDEQTRRAYLAALLEINTKIGALAPTDTLLTSIAEEAARLLAVDNAGFRLLEGDHLVLAGLAGTATQTMLRPRLHVSESLSGQVMSAGHALTLDLDEAAGAVAEHVAADRRLGYTKFLGVPLKVSGRTIGVLTFRARRPFTPRDQDLAEAFAAQAAIALEHARLYREAREHAARMRALAELGRVLSETLDPDAVGQRVADSICALLGARSSVLYRIADDGRLLAVSVSRGSTFEWARELAPGVGLAGFAVGERRAYAAPDVLNDPSIRYDEVGRERVAGSPDRALMGVPLLVRGRLFGALALADRTGRVFDAEDTRLAEAFADQAALALENARLYAETTRRRLEAEELARLVRTLTESLDVNAVGARIAESVLTLFSAQSSVLRVLRPDGGLEVLALSGRVADVLAPGHVLPPGTSTSGLAVERGTAVMTSDIASDPALRLTDELRDRMRGVGDAAQLSVPLRVKAQMLGALSISDRTGRVFTDADAQLLQAFADQAGLALENARLYAETTRRRQEAEQLATLAQTLTESLDVSDVVGRTVESVLPLFGAKSSILRLLQPDGSLVALGIGGLSRDDVEPGHVLRPGLGVLGRAAAEGRPVWSSDMLADPTVGISDELRVELGGSGHRSVLAVPLRVKAVVIGALGVIDDPGRQFTEEEARLLQAFADQAALALENARLFSLERARRRQIAALAEIEREFAAELDTERLLGLIVERSGRLFDADGSIYLLDDDGRLVRRAWTFEGPGMVRVTPGEGLIGAAIAERRGIVANDYPRSPLARPEFVAHGVRHAIVQPVIIAGRVHAAVVMSRPEGDPFLGDDLALLESFAAQAGIALENSRLYRAAETRATRLRTLARLNNLVTSSLDTADVLTSIARAAAEIMSAPFVGFWLADERNRMLHMQAAADASAGGRSENLSTLKFGEGAVGWSAVERRPLAIDDLFADGRFVAQEWARERGLRSLFCTPILDQDRLLGVLVLIGEHPFRFGSDDEDLLQSFSAQAAAAIRNARLYEDARRYAERLQALEEVNRLVSSSLNVEEVLQNLARAIAQFFDAAFVSLWAFDAGAQRLRRALTFGEPELAAELNDDLAVGEGAVGWVVAHREPITWTEVATDPRIIDAPPMRRRGLEAMTAYPIAIGDRVLGAFAVHRATAGPMTPETVTLMGSLAAQAAIALENARLYSETSRRLTETRALLEVAEILSATLDSRRLFKRVALKVAQVCRVDRCTLELWDGDRVVPLMSQFADGRKTPAMWEHFQTVEAGPPSAVPANAQVIETRQPLLIEDCAASALIPQEWVRAFGLRACLIVPMLRQERVIGVLTLDYCDRPGRFQDWQRDLSLAIAGQIALALENSQLYAEAQERLRETRTLLGVGQVLSQFGPTDVVLRGVAAEVGRAFGADMVGVYLADERRTTLVPAAGYHVPKELLDFFLRHPLVIERAPALTRAFRDGRTVASSDAHHDAGYEAAFTQALPPHSTLFAPTLAHGQPVGGLFLVWWRTGRAFSPAEIRLLDGIAAQVGLAMENVELARQTQIKLTETETLLSVSRAVSSTLDVQSLVRLFLRQVATTFGADTVGLWMVDETGQWLTPLAGYRVPTAQLEALREVRLSMVDHAIYAEAARTRRPVFSADAANDPRMPPIIREEAPHRSHLFVPVVAKDRMIGGFAVVWWERGRDFSPSDLALMEAIASQAGVAIENARLFEENRRRVEELSVLHELSRAVTGELDRTALLDALRTQLARVLDVRNMVVVMRTDEGEDLEVAMRFVDDVRDESVPRRSSGLGTGLMTPVLASGQPLRTDDYLSECLRRGVRPVGGSEPLRYWLGVPMNARDQVLGVLVLRSADRPFTEAEERLLLNIAHLTALALSSVRLYEERTRAYGELSAAQDQLVRTEKLRALGEMASGVAHDFNNLLASVLGRAQLLLRRVQEPQLRQWLQVIERSALDGAQTVKRLQEFTRIRRDQPLVPLDINQVVRDALEITRSRWKEEPTSRGISVEVRADLADLPAVLGDGSELREAMTNLILNALDAMPEGGTLTLTTALVDERVEVAVSDSGAGMPPEVREKVFDPFFTTKGPQGTGLGLSMTYGIISRHGGSIAVESEPDQGSTFRLSLPRGSDVQPAPPEERVEMPAVRSLRCLVVDDEPPVRAVIGDILESAGHTVVTLGDGGEAIARFGAEPFDLVVTDLAMPRVSGWQVARAVKQTAPHVPVFLVSGFGVELSPEERRAHGVDLVLVKPLQIQEILDAVAEIARTRTR